MWQGCFQEYQTRRLWPQLRDGVGEPRERLAARPFGNAGLVDVSGSDYTPKSVGVGIGYRKVAGDMLTLRIDGRFTYLTGDSIDFFEAGNEGACADRM